LEVEMEIRKLLVALSLLLLVVGAAFAGSAPGGNRIAAGYDYWQTLGSGATRYNFGQQPLPADFFCVGSERFGGQLNFEGVPLRTAPANVLGTTDTIIERLDDAVYNKAGVATTRIRARALDLVATKLVQNSCGAWKVSATLAGEQPVTRMTFHRQNQYGGVFDANLKLRVGVTFTNVDTGVNRTVVRNIDMPTVTATPYGTGTVAINRCLTPIEVEPGTPVGTGGVLIGDFTLVTGYADDSTATDHTTKLTPRRNLLPAKTQSVATGCMCNSQGQCMPLYSYHQPDCVGHYDCELHFTQTPCQLGLPAPECPIAVDRDANAQQLNILHERGFITEDPAVVARKQVRSADQIRADQASRLSAQIREIHQQ
jgi:hypothetical protein